MFDIVLDHNSCKPYFAKLLFYPGRSSIMGSMDSSIELNAVLEKGIYFRIIVYHCFYCILLRDMPTQQEITNIDPGIGPTNLLELTQSKKR